MIVSTSRQKQVVPPRRGSRLPLQIVLPWAIAAAVLVATAVVAFLPGP